jgi:hypothetical protein
LGKLANQTAAGSLKGEKSGSERINRYSSGMTVRLVRKQNPKGTRILSSLSIAISMLIS